MHQDQQILWTSAEVSAITGAASTASWAATGVSMTLEELQPGDLYIATMEDDLNAVFAKGAVAAIIPEAMNVTEDWPILKVQNVFQALRELAKAARFKTHGAILAVQGKTERGFIAGALAKASNVHRAGRHMSLSMAQMPEDYCFGVFGLSPSISPDIAIITDPAQGSYHAIFETKTAPKTVIVNADDSASLDVIARARAAGVTDIYTYGHAAHADACYSGAGTINILGETVYLPVHNAGCPLPLAAFLVMKIAGVSPQRFAAHMGNAAQSNVSLLTPSQTVFQVSNMIDIGLGPRTAILESMKHGNHKQIRPGFGIPQKLDTLNLVYASKSIPVFANARDVIKTQAAKRKTRKTEIETIVPDVLAPGDFVVFKDIWISSKAVFSEALRLAPKHQTEIGGPDYAV